MNRPYLTKTVHLFYLLSRSRFGMYYTVCAKVPEGLQWGQIPLFVYFATIKSAIRQAVRHNILQRNPVDGISIPNEGISVPKNHT